MLRDTNVLIESERAAYGLDALIADDDEPAIAAITVAELGVRVELSTGKRRKVRRSFLDAVLIHGEPRQPMMFSTDL